MDYFEPLANLLQLGIGSDWASRVDFIALVGLFTGGVFGLRTWPMARSQFHPVDGRFYDVCRWIFAVRPAISPSPSC